MEIIWNNIQFQNLNLQKYREKFVTTYPFKFYKRNNYFVQFQ